MEAAYAKSSGKPKSRLDIQRHIIRKFSQRQQISDFRVILKNVNYQLSQKNLVNDQVSEQDKSPDIPHTVLNLCIHLIAHGSEGAQITHAHSIMGTANDKSYDATHDNLEDDTHQGIHQDSHHDSTPSAVILRLMLFRFSSQS